MKDLDQHSLLKEIQKVIINNKEYFSCFNHDIKTDVQHIYGIEIGRKKVNLLTYVYTDSIRQKIKKDPEKYLNYFKNFIKETYNITNELDGWSLSFLSIKSHTINF